MSQEEDLQISSSLDGDDILVDTFIIDENEVLETLRPSVQAAKNYLYTLGFTNQDFIDEFGSENSENIITTAIFTDYIQKENNNSVALNNLNFFVGSIYAQQPNSITAREVFTCATSALGIKDLVDVVRGKTLSSFAARKALLKAVGKVAARIGLGVISSAIIIGEFAWCLGDSYYN